MWILGVDIGTTSLKMAVFQWEDDALRPVRQFARAYEVNVYHDGLFADIEPDKWKEAFVAGCRALAETLADVDVIALSGTTPGLTAMNEQGDALHPAILMLDQRSRAQARRIIDTIGLDTLLRTTANVPVAGGCSLAGILWLRDHAPDVFRRTHKFGHSNTCIARWLTGAWAMDPSSASLTALYNTTRNDGAWNAEIAREFDLSLDRLPQLVPAHTSVGRVHARLARDLGLAKQPHVLIGGNDAVLAAYSVGVAEAGEVVNVNGTCEISLVCLPECLPSPNYNVRAHVLPGRWLTLHVMNAGGKALEWFKGVFCREMTDEEFFGSFLAGAVDAWLERGPGVTYTPYLMGSRYSQEPLKAELLGLTQTTTREEILAALVQGLCRYQANHLREIGSRVPLRDPIHLTGGAVSDAMIRAKRRWMRDGTYVHEEESSVRGAALLARLWASQTMPPAL
jgi:sugar (pentulose or hexulose) kinase